MQQGSFAKLKTQAKLWRGVILPALAIIGLLVLVRWAGILQVQEWMAFDYFLQLRPTEAADVRVTIVGIDDSDVDKVGFPLSDGTLIQVLSILRKYQPRVVGLDLFREATEDPQRQQLAQVLRQMPNVIGVEVALNPEETGINVKPPPGLPPDRVGFADFVVDADGKLRRCLLASRTWKGELKYSFAFRLAQTYLKAQNIGAQHGNSNSTPQTLKSTDPIRFGQTPMVRFRPNAGGYVRADANGNQILLNFRSHREPFQVISLRDLLNGNFDPHWIDDGVVIIGMTAVSTKDTFITSAVKNTQYSTQLGRQLFSNQLIYGVELHAHATSQIISAVLDERAQMKTWAEFWEYLWIWAWGEFGIALGIMLQSPWKTMFCLASISAGLAGFGYLLLLQGWWISLVPTVMALWGAGLIATMVDRDLRVELEQRRLTIERTYEAVHNGPLQHLAVILRSIDDDKFSSEEVRSRLQNLNQELRGIYESMRQEGLDSVYVKGKAVLEPQMPLSELLYQVYDRTLDRDFPGFATILTYIPPNFAPLDDGRLSAEQKRGLCLFLEEALCNVGKHGSGTTRLDVVCGKEEGWYQIQVIDNGCGLQEGDGAREGGQGTHQAQTLARLLGGKFRRRSNRPQGTICELAWPAFQRWPRRF